MPDFIITPAGWRSSDPNRFFAFQLPNTVWTNVGGKHWKAPKPGQPHPSKPDGCPRGRPKDDETIKALKSSFAVRAYELGVLMQCASRMASQVPGCHCEPDTNIYSVEVLLDKSGIRAPEVEGLLKSGAKEAKIQEEACAPALRPRLTKNLALTLEKAALIDYKRNPISPRNARFNETLLANIIQYFQNAAAQQLNALTLISRALEVCKHGQSGSAKIAHDLRNGDVPTDVTASRYVLGTEEFQAGNYINYAEKFKLALFACVSPAYIWTDTAYLDPFIPEYEYFECAMLVGQLASGKVVEFPLHLARILLNRMVDHQKFMATGPHQLPARQEAAKWIRNMLLTVFDSNSLDHLDKSVRFGCPMIRVEPVTPQRYDEVMIPYSMIDIPY